MKKIKLSFLFASSLLTVPFLTISCSTNNQNNNQSQNQSYYDYLNKENSDILQEINNINNNSSSVLATNILESLKKQFYFSLDSEDSITDNINTIKNVVSIYDKFNNKQYIIRLDDLKSFWEKLKQDPNFSSLAEQNIEKLKDSNYANEQLAIENIAFITFLNNPKNILLTPFAQINEPLIFEKVKYLVSKIYFIVNNNDDQQDNIEVSSHIVLYENVKKTLLSLKDSINKSYIKFFNN